MGPLQENAFQTHCAGTQEEDTKKAFRRLHAPTASKLASEGSSSRFCASDPSSPIVSMHSELCTIRKVDMLASTRAISTTCTSPTFPNSHLCRKPDNCCPDDAKSEWMQAVPITAQPMRQQLRSQFDWVKY